MLQEAIDTDWISSVGPHLNAFEEDFHSICLVVRMR
jgi:dTDP-4-amino-4,6-dideoxygalactose transaminase